ncbi:MAG: guanine deaminase [Hyphomicrobiaceae bacterium]|nr:guanine deaminase [Hyphomicrobiaceae bacterium]
MTSPAADVTILTGQTLSFRADPFEVGPEAAVAHETDGAVAIRGGVILEVGPRGAVLARFPGAAVESYSGDLIMAGFVDCHVHYPQIDIIASYGEQLLEWLEKYTFPAEARFGDPAHAASAADRYLDECVRNGITSASVYCTVHPASVDALFSAARARGVALAAGKVMMDRNAPADLADTAQSGFDESKALISRWHGVDRLTYVVSPRFAVTSTEAQLEAAGVLWKESPGTLMQTHVSENVYEIEHARRLHPYACDYLDIYDKKGLLGPGANFGHAIHLSPREIARLCETKSGISHCPTSNLFIGSGLFDMRGLRDCDKPVGVGLATDVGGGSSFSMLATMKASYEICQLNGYNLHPAKAFYLATVGSAAVMRLGHRLGNLRPGYDADIVVLDLASQPLIARRLGQVEDIFGALFLQMILADDRAVRATYVAGRKAHVRAP